MVFPTHIVAAAGYVFDKSGNLLMIKTPNRGWDCTGGQVEVGENLEEAVLREILEESGVTARVKCLCGVYSNVGQQVFYDGVTPVPTKVMLDFICEYEGGELRTSEEFSEVAWVPKGKALERVITPVIRYRIEKVLEFSGRVIYASYVTKPEFHILTERTI